MYIAAGNGLIDDVIDPRATRATICRALEIARASGSRDPRSVTGWCRYAGASVSLEDPVVITCAISGVLANREQCPAIPYTPASTRRRRGGSWMRAGR